MCLLWTVEHQQLNIICEVFSADLVSWFITCYSLLTTDDVPAGYYLGYCSSVRAHVLCFSSQGSQLSWNSWNFKSVLKFFWNLKLSWNFTHLTRMSWNWLLMRNNILQFTVLFAALLSVYLFNRYLNLFIVLMSCLLASCSLVNSIMTALFNIDVHEWFLLKKKYAFTMCWWLKNVLKLSWNFVKSWSWIFTLSCWDPCLRSLLVLCFHAVWLSAILQQFPRWTVWKHWIS